MIPFDFQLRTRIVFGSGRLDQLGKLASELGARRALVVSDPGVVAAGHTQRGIDYLQQAGIETFLFHELHENPTTEDVDAGLRLAKRYDPQLIVGLGGGSSMDCAKGINFLFSNGGQMRDYWGIGKALKPMLPMMAVPTTAGTGSETQSFALISDAQSHVKMACGDKKATFRVAILDPELTQTQPRRVTALTGIDAISHAVETYVTKGRNELSLLHSREAWRRLVRGFPRVLVHGDDLDARGSMQLGACLAGLAIENSMLGITHSLANPLTADHGIPHGQAIAVMLPHVVRFNAVECHEWYSQLYDDLPSEVRESDRRKSSQEKADKLAEHLSSLAHQAELATTLRDLQVPKTNLPHLADEATKQWTAKFNPREASRDDLLGIYELAFSP